MGGLETKKAPRGREEFKRYQGIMNVLARIFLCFPRKARVFLFDFCRNINGKKGIAIRYILLKTLAKECGQNVAIFEGVYVRNIEQISFGSNVSIHAMSYIEGAGGIMLGNHVAIANGVSLISTEHNYSNPSIPIKDQGIELAPIVIEDDVWIGSRAVILSGNRIRKGSIIGAGAVVTKDVEEYLICVGVPARPVKDRHSL